MIIFLQDFGDMFMYVGRISHRMKNDSRYRKTFQIIEKISFHTGVVAFFMLRLYYTVTYGIYGLVMYFDSIPHVYVLLTAILMVLIYGLSVVVFSVSLTVFKLINYTDLIIKYLKAYVNVLVRTWISPLVGAKSKLL